MRLQYEILKTTGSVCRYCNNKLWLLSTVAADPSFYVCWLCEKIFQIGVGEVRKSGKCPCGGYFSDWHSHASDCIEINKKGKQY